MENVPSIIFPHLGIKIGYFPNGFYIGNFRIAFYGVIIAIGIIAAVALIMHLAKKTNQSTDNYVDIAIISIISAIVGARLYYVLFSLDYYIANPGEILNTRGGGLAIYGGIIGGFLAAFIVCRVKKIQFLRVLDTSVAGIVLAQAIGRWANFVNREAFGEYTDGLFAMQIRLEEVNSANVTDLMKANIVNVNGVDYVQVSPTFLYESIWCLVVFLLIMIFRKFQRYNGEVTLWYVGGYALGRAWIEGLRTDALYIGHTNIPVSQLLSIALLAGAFVILLINRIRLIRKTWEPEFYLVLPEGYPGTKTYSLKVKEEKRAKRAAKYKEEHGEEMKNASSWETYTVKKNSSEDVPSEDETGAAEQEEKLQESLSPGEPENPETDENLPELKDPETDGNLPELKDPETDENLPEPEDLAADKDAEE